MSQPDTSRTYDALPKPFGTFAHASVVELAGTKLMFISGITARDSDATDIESQTRLVYERMRAALQAEGGDMRHILKLNVYLTDVRDYPVTNKVRDEFFAGLPAPASTLVEVSKFVRPEALVEIEGVAAIPAEGPRV